MDERVAIFLWHDRLGDSRLFKLAHLLMKIIPVELEVMEICYTNLKASPSVEVRRFIKKLLEFSPEVLREYLIHLQEHMVVFAYKSDIPRAIWNPPLTRRGSPQPKCAAKVGVSESDTPQDI
ncbi:hypothetical protein CQW23_13659 [Capsicum baccatum]|uniref:Uncharacterized protein n=1 Tax=Capsicum baccatum TaxID=33114 RepID=A0A2G2WGY8_CAPBA|nr:hypothetical protein CQW23_13659 [Capsicum baccatum]